MRKVVLSVVSAVVLLVAASGIALAQTPSYPAQPTQTQPAQTPAQPTQTQPGSTGQMPSVANLKPFSIEADFMSLAGYLRYLMHQQTGQWMTYAEAQRAVKQGQ